MSELIWLATTIFCSAMFAIVGYLFGCVQLEGREGTNRKNAAGVLRKASALLFPVLDQLPTSKEQSWVKAIFDAIERTASLFEHDDRRLLHGTALISFAEILESELRCLVANRFDLRLPDEAKKQ